MKELSHSLQESCSAAILQGTEIVYVARMPAPHRIMSTTIAVGTRLPAFFTSLGRIQLGFLERGRAACVARRAGAQGVYAPDDRRSRSPDRAGRRPISRQGYSIVDEELEKGLRSLAVPIVTRSGVNVAAINLSAHSSRASGGRTSRPFPARIAGGRPSNFAIAALNASHFASDCAIVAAVSRAGTRGHVGSDPRSCDHRRRHHRVCSIARDAAGRGLSVFLCEQGDLAGAGSSASMKLVDGGLHHVDDLAARSPARRAEGARNPASRRAAYRPSAPLRPALSATGRCGRRCCGRGVRLRSSCRPTRSFRRHVFSTGRTAPSPRSCRTDSPARSNIPTAGSMMRGSSSSTQWMPASMAQASIRASAASSPSGTGRAWRLSLEFERKRRTLRGDGKGAGQCHRAVDGRCPQSRDRRQPVGAGPPGEIEPYRRSQAVRPRSRLCLSGGGQADCLRHPVWRELHADRHRRGGLPRRSRRRRRGQRRDRLSDLSTVGAYFRQPVYEDQIIWSWAGVRAIRDEGASKPRIRRRRRYHRGRRRRRPGALVTVYGGRITTSRRLAEQRRRPSRQNAAGRQAMDTGGGVAGRRHSRSTGCRRWSRACAPPIPSSSRRWRRRLVGSYGTLAQSILSGARSP